MQAPKLLLLLWSSLCQATNTLEVWQGEEKIKLEVNLAHPRDPSTLEIFKPEDLTRKTYPLLQEDFNTLKQHCHFKQVYASLPIAREGLIICKNFKVHAEDNHSYVTYGFWQHDHVSTEHHRFVDEFKNENRLRVMFSPLLKDFYPMVEFEGEKYYASNVDFFPSTIYVEYICDKKVKEYEWELGASKQLGEDELVWKHWVIDAHGKEWVEVPNDKISTGETIGEIDQKRNFSLNLKKLSRRPYNIKEKFTLN